ncbi:hypothetical protein [endosymbiont GvMRE of Glomus versiforme]|uniref:hypothetical protein n=1 Tax=endosymbiont GvMRE of Glomus versiforme TaxID=2039283 RepID=UPI000ED7EB96|nr:hypothetical protein [endosymbiont GvMRE of Glomus versiforme]RHZ35796.1 hypothetical protein GvMRE_Ic5g21 [endosymbiont GvMRE of Glomus versiforme]
MGNITTKFLSLWEALQIKEIEKKGLISHEDTVKLEELYKDLTNKAQVVNKILQENPAKLEELWAWLSNFTSSESPLFAYKQAVFEFLSLYHEKIKGKEWTAYKVNMINNMLSEIFLFNETSAKLDEINKKLNADYDLASLKKEDYLLLTQINKESNNEELRVINQEVCELSKKICQECLSLEEEETKIAGLRNCLENIENQEQNDYLPKIQELAINTYLALIKQTLQELDNLLIEKGLNYEEIGRDYRQEIKEQTFNNLENWKQLLLEFIINKSSSSSSKN